MLLGVVRTGPVEDTGVVWDLRGCTLTLADFDRPTPFDFPFTPPNSTLPRRWSVGAVEAPVCTPKLPFRS